MFDEEGAEKAAATCQGNPSEQDEYAVAAPYEVVRRADQPAHDREGNTPAAVLRAVK